MVSSLSNHVDNLAEGIPKTKSKYGHENTKCEKCEIKEEKNKENKEK